MPNVLLNCGCRANSINQNRDPSCTTHVGLMELHPVESPNLKNRKAKCQCGKTVDSSLSLAFFKFRGENSPDSINHCKNCGFYKSVHTADNFYQNTSMVNPHICKNFVPHGIYDYDIYYCGCRGWD